MPFQIFQEKLHEPKIKNSLVFLGIAIPAIQALIFIQLFGVNIPVWDDYEMGPGFTLFFNGDPAWIDKIFEQHNHSRIFFPKLIFIVDAILTNWDLKALMFLNWSVIGASLVPVYFLLKKFDKNFVWLMIPISVIFYSPHQYENLLWGWQIQWFLTSTCLLWTIFFLNRSGYSNFLISIPFAIIASFSLLLGLLIWPVGLISLVFSKNNKIKILIWLGSAILVYLLFFTDFKIPERVDTALSAPSLEFLFPYIFVYLGSGFDPFEPTTKAFFGISLLLFSIPCIIWFKFRGNSLSKLIPWFQISSIVFLTAIMTGINHQSIGLWAATASRYITISNLFVISALVFFFLILISKNKPIELKNIRTIFLIFIIISGSVLMSLTYLEGWTQGKIHYDKRIEAINCFSLPLYIDKCIPVLYPERLSQRFLLLANDLPKLKLSPFSYISPETVRDNDPLFNEIEWHPDVQTKNVLGNIDSINGKFITDPQTQIDDPTITISGWILDANRQSVEKLYLLIDDKPFLRLDKFNKFPGIESENPEIHLNAGIKQKYWDARKDLQLAFPEVETGDYSNLHKWYTEHAGEISYGKENFSPRQDIVKSLGINTDLNSGWTIQFLTNYLEEGCHQVSIGIVSNNTKAIIPSKSQICV